MAALEMTPGVAVLLHQRASSSLRIMLLKTWEWQTLLFPPLAGHSAEVPGWEEPYPRQSRLHPLRLPQAVAHVPHGYAWHDQPDPVSR